ncbi:hypothetical protein M409DRAFT_26462 [Zasmidium cellare ATCC 36951]|uniref:Uncharacterized protein n=1 Tax=Zasmidium cellare ATCC 36951 TaxID=1080233 RepID=A0A6A6C7J7_ZASCE|nr:uncharacterized protein M409DRAFT_26462 [Zasmidium cellare ATCC 36951]KAF2163015.1 hypothetical protein M409DRAFT_26462 [Zasmidium cellare ATCC 36951]
MDHLKVKVHHMKRKLSGQDNAAEHNGRFVLITNGTGYVSTWIIRQFLSNGYQVRTTVRSNVEGQDVRDTLSKYSHNLEIVVLTRVTEWSDLVKGVDGVVCTKLEEWQGLLEVIVKEAPQVQRVIVTSSLDAVVDATNLSEPGHVFSAQDWNSSSEEKALHAFVKDGNSNFSLATICPAMILGPLAHKTDLDGVKKSSEDLTEIWRILEGKGKGDFRFPAFVDVRNVAQAHLRAYELEVDQDGSDGGAERYIASGGSVTYAQVCSTLRSQFPEWRLRIPDPKNVDDKEPPYTFDNTKTKESLFMSFISLEDCLRDTAQSLMEVEAASKKNVRYDGQEWFRHV